MSSIIGLFARLGVCPSLVITLIQTAVTHGLLMRIHGQLLDTRIPTPKLLLCVLCSTTLHLLPLFLIECLLAPGMFASPWMVRIFIFVSPLSAVAYYYAVKGILGFSATKTSLFIHNMLITYYAASMAYLLQGNLLQVLIPLSAEARQLHIHKLLAVLLLTLELLACLAVVRVHLKRTRRYLIIPPNYTDKNVRATFIRIYILLTLFYGSVTVSGMLWQASPFPFFNDLLLIACALIYLFYAMSKLRERLLDWERRETRMYIESLQSVNQEFREIKHDFYNMLQTYSGFLELEDYDGLRRYHESLFQTTRHAGEFLGLIDALKNRVVVYSLLKCKAEQAEKRGIAFSVGRVCDIAAVALSDIDLSRVLNIVLDNAIEAASHAQEKQVSVSFERKEAQTYQIAITNTTAGDVDVGRIFERGYTTKPGHTGIGLTKVETILDGYARCKSRVKVQGNRFTLLLILGAEPDGVQRSNIA